MGWFGLSLRYIQFHKLKTVILVASIFLTAFLPISIKILLDQFNAQIVARSNSTPMVVGAKGSGLDLALHTLYFRTNNKPDTIHYGEVQEIRDTEWSRPIPIHSRFTAQKYPIVGTTLDYFRFRQLELESGSSLVTLGDCVLGALVAKQLGLAPQGKILSDSNNVMDIGGQYPLKMLVRGVLKPTNTPDDWAVFVDLKTVWIIEGLGHGHQNVEEIEDENMVVRAEDGSITATPAVLPFLEITDSNIGSFHFHGETSTFPISAIIAVSPDEESETKLIGRYIGSAQGIQIVSPRQEIEDLMGMIFQVKAFFDLNAIMIAISTAFLLMLVLMLSYRLRQREMETMFKIGCSRGTIVKLQLGEMGIIFLLSSVLVALGVWGVSAVAGDMIQSMLIENNTGA